MGEETVKRPKILWVIFVFLGSNLFSIQQTPRFYNVDNEVEISGTIQKIIMEPRSEGKAPFLVIELAEKNTQKPFKVEVSPAWFFDYDLHSGESLRIIGSLVSEGTVNLVMARQLRHRGELITVRDKHGFPNWSGGKGQQRGRRKRVS